MLYALWSPLRKADPWENIVVSRSPDSGGWNDNQTKYQRKSSPKTQLPVKQVLSMLKGALNCVYLGDKLMYKEQLNT